jgi:hypothetical protein
MQAMKLCPLFESIPSLNAAKNGTAIALNAVYQEGIVAANKVLPREAIVAAIVRVDKEITLLSYQIDKCVPGAIYREEQQPKLDALIAEREQLRALIPQDHADLTASDSELHGGGMDE